MPYWIQTNNFIRACSILPILWEIDIVDFMEKNYVYDLSIAEIAHYTVGIVWQLLNVILRN